MRRDATRRRDRTGEELHLFDPLPAEWTARGGGGGGSPPLPVSPSTQQLVSVPEARCAAPLELMQLSADAVQTPRGSGSRSFAQREGLCETRGLGHQLEHLAHHRGTRSALPVTGGSAYRRPASFLAAVAAADAAATAAIDVETAPATATTEAAVAAKDRATLLVEGGPLAAGSGTVCPSPARVVRGQTAPKQGRPRRWFRGRAQGEQSMPDLYSLERECRRAQESLAAQRAQNQGRATD